MLTEVTGLGGLILLALNIWALISIFGSNAGTLAKVLWCVFVLVLPLLGFLAWLLFGPRAEDQRA